MLTRTTAPALTVFALLLASIAPPIVAEDSWFDELLERRAAARVELEGKSPRLSLPDFGTSDYTFVAMVRTKGDGPLFARCAQKGNWSPGAKVLFIQDGRLHFDIGWVGAISGERRVDDGEWHLVAFVGGAPQEIWVDGELDVKGDLEETPDVSGHVFKLGGAAPDFPGTRPRTLEGDLDEVAVFGRRFDESEVRALSSGDIIPDPHPLAYWQFDGDFDDTVGGNHALGSGQLEFVEGRYNSGIRLGERSHLFCLPDAPTVELILAGLADRRDDEAAAREIEWELEDGIWGADWIGVTWGELARRYATATRTPESLVAEAKELAAFVETEPQLRAVRARYLASKHVVLFCERLAGARLSSLRHRIVGLYGESAPGPDLLARLDQLQWQAAPWGEAIVSEAELDWWLERVEDLRRDVLVEKNPLLPEKLLFIRRQTYHSSHFYTDFIDGCSRFGGNLCVLDLSSGEVTELVPEMSEGIFGRFDLHFDATRIVFDWKGSPKEGFRLYEIDIDPVRGVRTGGPRPLTSPPDDEEARIAKYDNSFLGGTARMYFHQTDDMHPCYLPDGGIVFTSSRCEYGTLCDAPDALATTVLHRIAGDGSSLKQLTNSAVSEFSPSVMADGRVLYTRWEYVDKGQLGVKCLWAMRPDGSASVEIYGNDITFPPSFLHGRQIPGRDQEFVFLGTPHYPQSGIGTVIRVDASGDIRTRKPMTYVTPGVDIRQEPGWNHEVDGEWVIHTNGPLYVDPYPLGSSQYLVAHNPDRPWDDPAAYGLWLITEDDDHLPIHEEEEISCWQPTPLRARRTPPVLPAVRDPELAERGLALCLVQDVHHGMSGIGPGEVKYLRVMEQLPRPWDCRRFWDPYSRKNSHTSLVSANTALAAKAMWGVVPVHEDGSAHFYVPADRNIYLQALDENYMELQRERTYVNYRPGERRSCVGCHETPNRAALPRRGPPIAAALPPVMPGPQPGDDTGRMVMHYPTYVQPVLDRHCVSCHGAENPDGDLDLTGELTRLFNRSYENLMEFGSVPTFREASDWEGTPYCPPKTIGSFRSPLIASLREGQAHRDIELPFADFVKLVTWIDASGVYYGSYWGRRNLEYREHPFFRPDPTFEEAISTVCPVPVEER